MIKTIIRARMRQKITRGARRKAGVPGAIAAIAAPRLLSRFGIPALLAAAGGAMIAKGLDRSSAKRTKSDERVD